MKYVVINDNACGTWLEPYIGHEFKYMKETKTEVFFIIEYGHPDNMQQVSTDLKNVDIKEVISK